MRVIMQTCPPRADVFADTLKHAPAQTEVVMDVGGGNLPTFLEVLRRAGPDGFLFLEDDLIFTSRFEDKAAEVIAQFGTSVVSFFSFRRKLAKGGAFAGKEFWSNLCVWYPPGMAGALLRWYAAAHAEGYRTQHGDQMVRDYLAEVGVRFWQHSPSLVQHKIGKSVSMKGQRHLRQSPVFEA